VSELFGGLLKPGDAGMTALRLELERRRDSYGSEFPRPPYVFRGGADMCLRHGESFKGRVTPEKWRHLMGENGRCYINALTAAEAHPELRYFEGYYSWGKGHFTSHGWVVDDEGVVELSIETWLLENFHDKNGGPILPAPVWSYWGVEFDPRLVRWHVDDPAAPRELPMLDRTKDDHRDDRARARGLDMTQSHDFPILKVPYSPGRTSL
jgi:hypothetical protein